MSRSRDSREFFPGGNGEPIVNQVVLQQILFYGIPAGSMPASERSGEWKSEKVQRTLKSNFTYC